MGIGIEEHDHEGRVIALEFERFFLVTVYTPNSQRGPDAAGLPHDVGGRLRGLPVRLWTGQKPVVVCGDMNVAHKEIDLKNPKTNTQNAGFTPQEREKMTALLGRGFVDTFRLLHPDERDRYSWWSYMQRSRERNIGWRIDYFLVSERIAPNVAAGGYRRPGDGQRPLPRHFGTERDGLSMRILFASDLHGSASAAEKGA